MFQTNDNAEVIMPQMLAKRGERTWWHIKTRLHDHWFHVEHLINTDEGEFSVMIYFSVLDHLLEFSKLDHIEITEIGLVSPGDMNGEDEWKMESLKEIWVGEEPNEFKQEAHIFILVNGNRYIDSLIDTPEESLVNKRLVLEI